MFNREQFVASFETSLTALAQSEHVTKRELRALSRSVLEATHETGDIQYVNKTMNALSPVNKRVAKEFFLHFSGFSYEDAAGMFTKKSKKRYDQAHKDSGEFLAEPTNNIWSWAERNIEIEKKDFTLDKVTDGVKAFLKKADAAGFKKADVMRAIIKGGIDADTIIACMDELGFEVETK